MASPACGVGRQTCVTNHFVAVFLGHHGSRAHDTCGDHVTRGASYACAACFRWWFGRRIGKWSVATTAKGEWFDGVGVYEVFVFPGAMMERLVPFGSYFGMAIAATVILGQTNARDPFEVSARGRSGKGHVIGAARSRSKQNRAGDGSAYARKKETRTHGMQDAGRCGVLSISIHGKDVVDVCRAGLSGPF